MPYAAMLLVVLFWGSAAAVGRSIGDAGTPLQLAVWRVGLGLGLLALVQAFLVLRRRMGRRGREGGIAAALPPGRSPDGESVPLAPPPRFRSAARLLPIWIGGILGYGVMIWLFFAAARATLASHLVLILSMAPICTLLLDRAVGGGRGHAGVFLPAGLSLIGIAIMVGPSLAGSDASLAGDSLALLALLAFSAYTVITKRYSGGMAALALNVHGMAAGFAALWAMLALTEGRLLPAGFDAREQGYAIGYLGFASTGAAYLLYAWALSRLPMERAMPLIYLQPVVGVLLSVLWLGEKLTPNILLGMCAIVGGLLWNHRYTRMPARPEMTRRL